MVGYEDKDLTSKQIEKRDEDWRIVTETWDKYKPQLLEKKSREQILSN